MHKYDTVMNGFECTIRIAKKKKECRMKSAWMLETNYSELKKETNKKVKIRKTKNEKDKLESW